MPLIRTVLGSLMRKGVDADAFLRDLQLEQTALQDPSRRIDLAVYDQVQERAMQVLGDPALGLHMGEHTSPNTLGLLGYLLLSAPTLGDAIEQWMHFHSLVSDAEPSRLHVQNDTVLFEYQFPRSTPDCNRIRAEFGLVQMTKLAGLMLGSSLPATEVRFEHPRPDYADEYKRVFHGTIHFNCPHTAVLFPAEILRQPLPAANPGVQELLKEEAERQLLLLDDSVSLADKVERFLLHALQKGKPGILQAAEHFGMNERTFRRKLEGEDTSFTELLGQVQLRVARRLLVNTSLSMDVIAERLCFSEPSAFHRAFKRWTGQTPSEYRDSQVKR
ncbi:MAG TPA: AraC family transcriptional regulator [Dongiaceae bacterium]|nr:AraC family transcriptional regulator [Dongiaceae bacterium]